MTRKIALMNTIALMTDFGEASAYVAQMKGVLFSIGRGINLVDISHAIKAQSIDEARYLLEQTAFAFPLGTVFVVVVDPGVGTGRRGIAVRSKGMTFVGPDNGVLSWPLEQADAEVYELTNRALFQPEVSTTFHGRDIFAPVAAEISMGLDLCEVGPLIDDPVVKRRIKAVKSGELTWKVRCEWNDNFGNVITNLKVQELPMGVKEVVVHGDEIKRAPFCRTYGEVPEGDFLALASSSGYVEFAIRNGSARAFLGDGLVERVFEIRVMS